MTCPSGYVFDPNTKVCALQSSVTGACGTSGTSGTSNFDFESYIYENLNKYLY
jgi:hypothetical protein